MRKFKNRLFLLGLSLAAACCLPLAVNGQERNVIDANFPGAYQVEVADINGDKRPDIIAVGGNTCAWYENPTWKKRVVGGPNETPGIISSASADLDGDGKAEIAIAYEFAMNKPASGKLAVAAQGDTSDGPWTIRPITSVGSIHRLRWGDIDGDQRLDLVVAPIFGPDAKPPTFASPARAQMFSIKYAHQLVTWSSAGIADRDVIHAIELIDVDGDGRSDLLTASNEGVDLYLDQTNKPLSLTPGAAGNAPKRGSSEVHLGRFADRRRFLATVGPWHGNQVAVCFADDAGPGKAPRFGPLAVIDDTLADGHALWVADVDGDGDDEIFAGHRGKDRRVSLYDYDRAKNTWSRTVLDRDIAAQDLRGGDLDGDGTPDVVAVGGATHNVVWYRFKRP